MPKDQYALDTDTTSAFTPLVGFELDGSVPIRKYRKGLITPGTYIHPQEEWQLDVDAQRLSHWVDTFKQMQANGVRVPLLRCHDWSGDVDNCIGYLTDMHIKDGWLSGTHEVKGLQDQQLVERIGQVSIGLEKGFRDGKGNTYSDVITHIAITPCPVVPGQTDFERLAASRTGEETETLHLSRGKQSMLNQKELSRIATLVGDDQITADNALDSLEAKFGESDSELQGKYAASLKTIDEMKSRVIPASDPETIEDRAQLYGERIDRLSTDGKVPSEVAEKLKLCLLGETGKRQALALSTSGGRDVAWAKEVITLLEEIPQRVELGSKTGAQMAIADDHGRSGINKVNEQVFSDMLAMAGSSKGKGGN